MLYCWLPLPFKKRNNTLAPRGFFCALEPTHTYMLAITKLIDIVLYTYDPRVTLGFKNYYAHS